MLAGGFHIGRGFLFRRLQDFLDQAGGQAVTQHRHGVARIDTDMQCFDMSIEDPGDREAHGEDSTITVAARHWHENFSKHFIRSLIKQEVCLSAGA